MTTPQELIVYETNSPEARACLARHRVIYGSDGLPMASVYFVFPHLLTLDHPRILRETHDASMIDTMQTIAQELGPLLTRLSHNKPDAILHVLQPHTDFIRTLTDEEICAVLNTACECSLEHDKVGDMIGHRHATEIFRALQKLDKRFGNSVFGPYYTYNDPDNYCGQHDIQICYPTDDDIYGCNGCDLVFVQIHPGGDARNMAEGRFYVAEGIDDITNLFGTLGACHAGELCTTVEIPVEFPLEQWIRKVDEEAWDSMYREEVKNEEGDYAPKDTLDFHDFKDGMCRTQFSPNGDRGAGIEVYRCFDVAAYKGRDLWTWVPEGAIVGEMRKQWGVSDTPWKDAEFQYSTGGYFKWEGPKPETPEWAEMLAEHGLDPIEPRKEPSKENQEEE